MEKEELQALLQTLSLLETDTKTTTISNADITLGIQHCTNSLVGKFITTKEIQVKNLRPAIEKSWNTKKFKIVKTGRNFYQFKFEVEEDYNKVLNDGPWCFDNILLVLKPWSIDLDEISMEFQETHFWIQVWGLPIHCYTMEVGRKIAKDFIDCSFLQIREDAGTGQLGFRFKAAVSLVRPLPQLLTLILDESKKVTMRALLQYERLPSFCFHCGFIGHVARTCPLVEEEFKQEAESKFKYGVWSNAGKLWSKLVKEERLHDMDYQLHPSKKNPGTLQITSGESGEMEKDKSAQISSQQSTFDTRKEEPKVVESQSELTTTAKHIFQSKEKDEAISDMSLVSQASVNVSEKPLPNPTTIVPIPLVPTPTLAPTEPNQKPPPYTNSSFTFNNKSADYPKRKSQHHQPFFSKL